MIYKNKEHDQVIATVAEFGHGDIAVVSAYNSSTNVHSLLLANLNKVLPIGQKIEEMPPSTTIKEVNPQIIMTFDKVESIDVVMYFLSTIREQLIDESNGK